MSMMQKQIELIVDRLIEVCPPELHDIIKNDMFIAGGAFASLATNTMPNDYDFYFKSKEAGEKFTTTILTTVRTPLGSNNFYLSKKSLFAHTYLLDSIITLQFITKIYGHPEKVISNFDFQHTCNYYDIATKKLKIDNIAGMKSLVFRFEASHPVSALQRIEKFIQRGYSISSTEYLKICLAVQNIDFSDHKQFEDQLSGMYGGTRQLKKLLVMMDEFNKANFKNKLKTQLNE